MEIVALSGGIIALIFIGLNVLHMVMGSSKENRCLPLFPLETIFISYGIGLGFISLEMLIFYLFGVKFTVYGLLIPWVVLIAVNAIRYVAHRDKIVIETRTTESEERYKFLNIFLISGISLEAVYAFFRALIKPIESYDAVAIYAIKSKIFFIAKAIPETYFPILIHGFPHPDYPLNIPLSETFFYIAMGSLNDQLVKIIFPLFFLGILILLYYAIRRFASRTYALLFTFLLASIPHFNAYAANAYQELPLSFYYFSSALLLFSWIEDKKSLRPLVLSAIMVALAGWTKNEGLMYCAINTVLVLFFSMRTIRKDMTWKTLFAPIAYIVIVGLLLLPWIWIKHKFGIANDEINLANLNPVYLFNQIHKLVPIFYELQKQLFGPKKWILLWPVVIFAAALNYRKLFKGIRGYISVSIILAFLGYILFYMISYVDVVFFASKTWARFLLHFLPLLVLWLAYILKEDVKI